MSGRTIGGLPKEAWTPDRVRALEVAVDASTDFGGVYRSKFTDRARRTVHWQTCDWLVHEGFLMESGFNRFALTVRGCDAGCELRLSR